MKQVFAEWIFDAELQCRKGTPDNSVCRGKRTMNPWLGGDFNPWEWCDTETPGLSEETNERISVSCHPLICDGKLETPYYENQPNENCQRR